MRGNAVNWLGERLLGGLSKPERDAQIERWAERFAAILAILFLLAFWGGLAWVVVHFIVKYW
jgi:hypothetical protein